MKKLLLSFIIFVFIGFDSNAQGNKHNALNLWNKHNNHNKISFERGINSLPYTPGKEIVSSWDTVNSVWSYVDSIRNTYNSSGNIILKLDYYGGPTYPGKTVYIYNGNGKETSDTSKNWNSSSYVMYGLNTFTYDVNGNQTKHLQYSGWDGSVWSSGDKDDYTFDVNNNETQDLHQTWNGTAWVNSSKSDIAWSGTQMIEEIDQYWDGNGWVNYFKADYTYSSGQLAGFSGSNWSGTNWINSDNNILLVWYQWNGASGNSKLSSYTQQVPIGNLWKDSIKYNYTYDSHGNQIDYLVQSKPANTYITTDEEKHIFQYDGNSNIIEDIYQNWSIVTTATRNYIKRDFSDFQFLTVTAINENATNNEQWTIFPNPSSGVFKLQMNSAHAGSVGNYQV